MQKEEEQREEKKEEEEEEEEEENELDLLPSQQQFNIIIFPNCSKRLKIEFIKSSAFVSMSKLKKCSII